MRKINWRNGVATVAVVAGLMLTSVPGVALAATVDSSNAMQTINKTWTVDSDYQYSADEEFTFQLTYAGADKVGNNELQDFSDFGTKTVSLKTTGSANLCELFDGVNFTNPGVYYFELREQAGSNSTISYSDAVYTVQVSVVWDDVSTGTVKIQSVNLATGAYGTASFEAGSKTTSADFTNKTDKASNTLNVTKKVAGMAANTSDQFTFTIELSGLQAGHTYEVVGADNVTAGEDGKATITATLSHNGTVSVKNLPNNATWIVTETDAKGYDSTNVTAVDNTLEEGDTTSDENKKATGTVTGNDTDSVLFTNNKGFAPATGITMNTLPFVGVGVVAAAGAVTLVISRKRRAGEDF